MASSSFPKRIRKPQTEILNEAKKMAQGESHEPSDFAAPEKIIFCGYYSIQKL
jgi:hypothetical protein